MDDAVVELLAGLGRYEGRFGLGMPIFAGCPQSAWPTKTSIGSPGWACTMPVDDAAAVIARPAAITARAYAERVDVDNMNHCFCGIAHPGSGIFDLVENPYLRLPAIRVGLPFSEHSPRRPRLRVDDSHRSFPAAMMHSF